MFVFRGFASRRRGRLLLLVFAVCAILAACGAPDPPDPPDPPAPSLGRAVEMFAQRRYFELRKLLAALPAEGPPEVLFFRGMMAAVFNQPEAAVGYLNSYLEQAGTAVPRLRRLEALRTLADEYAALFQYGRSAELRAQALDLARSQLNSSAVADLERLTAFWRSLAGVPPQTVTIPEYTVLPLVGDSEIMADFGGPEVALLPDTEASLSLITRAEAERLGFRIFSAPTEVGTATGEGVLAYPALAPEFRFGDIVIRNAIFLVVPQRMLYFPEIKKQRSGIVGFPILSAFRQFTFDRGGTLTVPAQPDGGGEPNFFLYHDNPVIEAEYEHDRLLLMLDTGSFSSELYSPFFERYREDVLSRGAKGTATIEGIGGQVAVAVYLLGGVSFKIAGQHLDFHRELVVLTQPTSEGSGIFDGVLGSDIFPIFSRVTVNYAAMRFSLER